MRTLLVIARNTFREIIRDRILYGLIVFAVLLLGLSLVLGQLSFAEQVRISLDFGLAGIHISAVILSVFVGSTLVSKEIDKQTILTLLARPISRSTFLLGKFFGLMMVTATVILGLTVILLGIMVVLKWEGDFNMGLSLLGILLEAMILLSLTLLWGMITRPILTVAFSAGVFIIGHWVNDLAYFAKRSESGGFIAFSKVVGVLVPNLENFNWRSAALYNEAIPAGEILKAVVYGGAWSVFLFVCAALLFRRRDFV